MILLKYFSYFKNNFFLNYLRSIAMVLIILLVFLENNVSGQKKTFTAKINKDGVQVIEMKAGDYYFSPNFITVKVNVPVEIKLIRKSEFTPHNIMLKAPEAGISISTSIMRESKVIKFTPVKTGKYLFICDRKVFFFIKHKSKGMQGILKVIE